MNYYTKHKSNSVAANETFFYWLARTGFVEVACQLDSEGSSGISVNRDAVLRVINTN